MPQVPCPNAGTNLPDGNRTSFIFGTLLYWLRLSRVAEQPNHFPVERWNVVGHTTRYKVAVHHDLLIHPLRACIPQIRLERGPRSDPPPACSPGLNDRPGSVADGCHWFASVEEGLDKCDRLRLDSE